ncbi:MAG: methyltransferase domain-containing protein [Bacillota bacterium]
MRTHWEHLVRLVPTLPQAHILDLGSGKGAFLIEAAQHGATAKGVEYSAAYIEHTQEAAQAAGVDVDVRLGAAEAIPYPDASFDFVNIAEVIEHVEDPMKMLDEVHRVLKPHGKGYLSVPNRFGFNDPHFRLYFVNWLPRSLANPFISLFGKHKNYADRSAGLQDLTKMHYYTYGSIKQKLEAHGFHVVDTRAERIRTEFPLLARVVLRAVYPLARALYFNTAHLLIEAV